MRRIFLMAVLMVAGGSAYGREGCDFNGYYSLGGSEGPNYAVEVSLTLQLFNRSGADLKEAVVVLRPSMGRPGILASLPAARRWPSGRDLVVSQRLSISRDEYQRWSAGVQPVVFVTYRDDHGEEWMQTAQLSRRPTIAAWEPSSRPTRASAEK